MASRRKKFVFITGGVTSSLGKGLASASLAGLLERRGIKINMLKMDPYINVDPGTMSPIQHGEVFVTDDGAETDLDLGHYERFTSLTLSKNSNFTTGQVYLQVIENERKGKYLGKTVQVVPHITDEIKRRIHLASQDGDLLLSEIGGTVGDIESLPFLEAIRQFAQDVGPEHVTFVHLVLLPFLQSAGEVKTKPAQHSVKELRSIGLFPNVIICRSDRKIGLDTLEKISLFCNVPKDNVFECIDFDCIYEAPLSFYKQGLDNKLNELLGMWSPSPDIGDMRKVVDHFKNPLREVRIGIVGKYTELIESYKSLHEALTHAALHFQLQMIPVYIDAQDFEKSGEALGILEQTLLKVDGILVPGGFGERACEGKIRAIEFAREREIPYLGICLGMQLAIIEFMRNVCNMKKAVSDEFNGAGESVIHYMKGQRKDGKKGGSMRLGAYDCHLKKDSLAYRLYKNTNISERHRHRLEVKNDHLETMEGKGMVASGINRELNLVEIVELKNHPFMIGCQFHPEFKSRPDRPHPLFLGFVLACDSKQENP